MPTYGYETSISAPVFLYLRHPLCFRWKRFGAFSSVFASPTTRQNCSGERYLQNLLRLLWESDNILLITMGPNLMHATNVFKKTSCKFNLAHSQWSRTVKFCGELWNRALWGALLGSDVELHESGLVWICLQRQRTHHCWQLLGKIYQMQEQGINIG